ncbi:cytochrome d ubiquinol oxidase subunit II [Plantibacter flavus]|jgi:cytochrome d ubiquinol oxidase subunit II|uniref:Cytochrome bd-I ubiquinol oxidase subunit 2 apoprotein n=3 Tax=Plantibacter TaxID=190323 RepID=A0A1S7B8K9_9MICO|nr:MULTISPECIES: cytochrome d ubiquinol oxidase subunit II [Plantibacter]AQX80077.1 cytochrome d ubiquinol oxidase subunit II [Plantibacter flavus]MBD8102714.1 cytochrome d ubiquinol oxidase subunit II [Plantibacter sp. CFBP 8775]MBD8466557.1 cytochrome d ubiquinol oxidase subunit II [Plantibacter sp. CFBP 8798]MBD8515777.1 cytochrome d ubiquinol oxidase subunit II [Plantibacter sp. CFBP 8804]MBF4565179.1 cytochrome d ubiquinol oxidase subunit II [Plantibacter sp. VKM Ac-2876]
MDLTILWFWIIAALFVGYFVLDGFDFGVGMTIPFLGKDETDRRMLINTIGPVWDLNETWLIVAGASLFAAFPEWYATLFSGFYLPLLFILLALIIRGVSFEYRHQRPEASWKRRFDLMIIVGSALPAFLWGVAFANIVQGVPLDADHNFTGTLFTLLNPYGILGGLTTLVLFFAHGAVFASLKTEGDIRERARRLASRAGLVAILLAASFLGWTVLAHFSLPVLILAAIAAVSLISAWFANSRGLEGRAFALMAVTVAAAVLTLFTALFPAVMPASNDPANSLTIANASSTEYTLTVMSWTALIFLPLILAYQGWTYWVFRKRITRKHIEAAAH